MPTLAGWLTGEQVPLETIEQVLTAMGTVLGQHGGQPARSVHPGAGLIAFSDAAYAMQQNNEAPVLDWVPDRRTLVYRRPLAGWHPLYFITDWPAQGNLLFASEIKALLAVGVKRQIHLPALAALHRYGFIPAPWTMLKNIQVVPAGSILRWQRAKTVVNHASDYHLSPTTHLSLTTLAQQFALTSSYQLPPHEHLAALTDGSPASALSTFLATQHTSVDYPIVAFDDDYRNSGNNRGQQLADICQRPFLTVAGTKQPEFWTATLAGTESPCVDTRPLALHQLLHTTATRTGARVALCGLGASSLLQKLPQHIIQAESILDHYQATISSSPSTHLLWSPEAHQLLQQEEPWEQTFHARKLVRLAEQLPTLEHRLSYLDLHLRLPDALVCNMYQLAVQEQMALRSPYLDHTMLNMLTRLPEALDDGTQKEDIPARLLEQAGIYLNETQKQTSLTLPLSLSHYLHASEPVRQTLAPEKIQETGIFSVQFVEQLLQQAQHEVISRELLLVFTTQLLCSLFDATLF